MLNTSQCMVSKEPLKVLHKAMPSLLSFVFSSEYYPYGHKKPILSYELSVSTGAVGWSTKTQAG